MERLDDILGYKNLHIYQNSDFFSFSLDSIILANYANIRLRDKKIIDLCTGNGVIPLILSRRTNNYIVGVEIQEKLAEMAQKSVFFNHLEKRISIVNDDVKNYSKNHLNEYDLVLCNPPYFKVENQSTFNLSYEKTVARHEVFLSFHDLCVCVNQLLKDNGSFCFVHRTNRFIEIISELRKNHLEPKKIKFIYETVDKPSCLVMIEAQKSAKCGLIVAKPLIQYHEDGTMTNEYLLLQKEIMP